MLRIIITAVGWSRVLALLSPVLIIKLVVSRMMKVMLCYVRNILALKGNAPILYLYEFCVEVSCSCNDIPTTKNVILFRPNFLEGVLEGKKNLNEDV